MLAVAAPLLAWSLAVAPAPAAVRKPAPAPAPQPAEGDALHLRLRDVRRRSEEVRPGIVLDFNERQQVVGVEILRVKQCLPDANLKELKFEVA